MPPRRGQQLKNRSANRQLIMHDQRKGDLLIRLASMLYDGFGCMPEDERSPSQNEIPSGGKFLSPEFVKAAPVGEGVRKLVDWMSTELPRTVANEGKEMGVIHEAMTRGVGNVLMRYAYQKEREYRAGEIQIDRRPLETKIKMAKFDSSHPHTKTPEYRKGRLQALREVLEDLDLVGEQVAIDYLFAEAEMAIPSAFTDAIESLD